jgi:AbrB family looped-hinge helix DNA binding protein
MKRYTTRMTSKGQVTIPKEIRDRYGLSAGDYLVLEPKDENFVVRKGEIRAGNDEGFEALAERIAQRFEERGITRSEVEEAIRWARRRP